MSMYDKISKGIKLQHKEIKEERKVNYNHRLSKEEINWLNGTKHSDKLIKLTLQDHMIYL